MHKYDFTFDDVDLDFTFFATEQLANEGNLNNTHTTELGLIRLNILVPAASPNNSNHITSSCGL